MVIRLMEKNRSRLAFALTILLPGICAGCGRAPAEAPVRTTVIPPVDEARDALRLALEDWQAGRPKGTIARPGSPVGVVDSLRTLERPLRSYQILGPLASDQGRCFAVRLALEAPDEERDERYLIFGWSPLWVFRMQDYELISHWEHAMDPIPEEAPPDTEPPHTPRDHPGASTP